jgi:hypothetical protein
MSNKTSKLLPSKSTGFDSNTASKEEYFVVDPAVDNKDAKGSDKSPTTHATLSRPLKLGVGRDGMRVNLCYRYNFASSANTAYNTVHSVAPANSGEFAGFAALFDEMIVDGGHIQFMVFAGGTVPAGNLWGGLSFDPVNFGVYTATAQIGHARQHILYPIVASLGPSIVTPLGPLMHKMAWKVPKGPPARISGSSNTTNFSNEWSATSDANDSYGFLKPYMEAGPTTVTTNLSGFVTLQCRFRSRT